MNGPRVAPAFSVVPGVEVHRALVGAERRMIEVVEAAYRVHGAGRAVNPPSCFLRFPDRPTARIIALPASLGGGSAVDGIKWISSFPGNVADGLPRASAVLVLNDPRTGYPYACLEASIISAVRTAASAALAADRLSHGRPRPTRAGFIGTGLIARYIHRYLTAAGWHFESIMLYDVEPDHARRWRDTVRGTGAGPVAVADSAEAVIRSSDLLVFATVAAAPHIHDPAWFDHHPVALHVSLRDLAPAVILGSVNVVDDETHCLTANTSVHLAEQAAGHRSFLYGRLVDVLIGRRAAPPADRTVVFSPFGLGVLDLAVGRHVYETVAAAGGLTMIDGFFHETDRYA